MPFISINGSTVSSACDDKIDATAKRLESSMQACGPWHAIDALVVVARSRGVRACRCDAVDAPARCEPGT